MKTEKLIEENTNIISPLGEKISLLDMAFDHLDQVLMNADEFNNPIHFSTVQYSNIHALINHNKVSIEIFNALARYSRMNTYLNFGMGPGFLEYYADKFKSISMESVEWEEQQFHFKIPRRYLKVQPTYICNSILDDNFEIFECDKKYDFITLVRFFPLNRSNADLQLVKKLLKKFQKYTNKVIIFDDLVMNYNIPVKEFFNSITIDITLNIKMDYQILNITDI